MLIKQSQQGRSGEVDWETAERDNENWKGICVWASAPERKMVSPLKRYLKKRGTAGEGDKEAYLTPGCEDQMRSGLVKAFECLLSVIKKCYKNM